MTVYFIGAGPGDPELITVKGQRLIRSCPLIIYAGSLVPEAVLQGHQAEQVINSAELHLEQIIDLIKAANAKGQDVARVHSGDPSLYGALGLSLFRQGRYDAAYTAFTAAHSKEQDTSFISRWQDLMDATRYQRLLAQGDKALERKDFRVTEIENLQVDF